MATRVPIPPPAPIDLPALSRRFRLPIADLRSAAAHAVALVPERWARQFNIVPLAASARELEIATADPLDVECERTLAFATGRHVKLALADPAEISTRIDELYRPEIAASAPESLVDVQHLDNAHEAAPPSATDDGSGTATSLVDELLAAGISARASDIHIEPEEQGIAVRHRVDGVLVLARTLSRHVAPALVSRIKILSGLDIADRLRPQDGRARVAVNGVAVDLRISTLPASHGEKVVIRVLDARSTVLTLEGMGFHADELQRIERLLESREGLILVTGPTGSGKTTTLYAALRKLKQRGVNIVTVEDPIEYRLPGIVQVQVNEKAGLTFAAALRSIMRQDPDVLLIGEIRDRETAEIAIQASLTGHLVLSTLHTNDAASAVTRLIDIGVASYKIATAVKGVLAQRLVRRRCPSCTGNRCQVCGGTGFHGRLAVVEVLIGSPEFERAVAANETAERLAEVAVREGMRSLWQSGLTHANAGRTTLEEVRRVASPEAESASVPAIGPPPVSGASAVAEPPFGGEAFELRSDLDLTVARAKRRRGTFPAMAEISIGTVDIYVVRPLASGWRVLVLQRSADTRCPTAWETVHGRLEPGEQPEQAAVREVLEETALRVERLYNVTVQPFYLHKPHVVQLAVVFAAFVAEPAEVVLGPEHQQSEWLSVNDALTRMHWPRERAALQEVVHLLGSGDAGPVEDVLRVF